MTTFLNVTAIVLGAVAVTFLLLLLLMHRRHPDKEE